MSARPTQIQWRCKAEHRRNHGCEGRRWQDYNAVPAAVDAEDFMETRAPNSPHFEFRIKPTKGKKQ